MQKDSDFCEKHKKKMKAMVAPFSENMLFFCDECGKEADERIKEIEQSQIDAAKKNTIKKLRENCQIGKRFESSSFDNYKPACQEAEKILCICRSYANDFKEMKENGDGLLFLGNPGTGKNHLAAAICNAVMEKEYSTIHTTVLKMMRQVKSTWAKNSEQSEAEAISSFRKPDLLVIDEVGVQFDSKAEQLILTEIINDRYEWMLPTILISNLSVGELANVVGERVIDRFRENSKVLVFNWESYRKSS